MRSRCGVYFQERGRPEQLDASVMANPDYANNSNDADLRTTDLRTTDLRTTDLRTTDVRTTDLHTTDLRTTGHRYNNITIAASTGLSQSQAAPAFIPPQVHRHPFPFSAIAGQLPAAGFPPPPNVDYCPGGKGFPPPPNVDYRPGKGFPPPPNVDYRPPNADYRPPNADYHPPLVTAPANAYRTGFNPPRPFSHQFASGVAVNDRNILPANSSNIDAVRPIGAPFDNYSAMFGVVPPISSGSSPKFYPSCQSVSYPPLSSGFMSRAGGTEFASALRSSSARPWPPVPPDVLRPTFGELYPFQLTPNEASVPQTTTVGSDSLSSGSPITDLLDHRNSLGNSPTQLPRATFNTDLLDHRNSLANSRNSLGNSPTQLPYGCAVTLPSPSISDVMESIDRTVASSPFCRSPIGGLQLSQSLPAGVRFNCPHSVDDGTGVVGQRCPASRMHFDNLSTSSPMSSERSLFQTAASGVDDRTAPSARFQVELFEVSSVRSFYSE